MNNLSLCPSCKCMTYTIDDRCGKCDGAKNEITQPTARELLTYSKKVMDKLEKYGGDIVPHLLDTDDNDGQELREVITKAETELRGGG